DFKIGRLSAAHQRTGNAIRRGLGKQLVSAPLEDAKRGYSAPETKCDVVLLQSDGTITLFAKKDMAWSNVVKGRLFVHRIPGWLNAMYQGVGARLIADHLRPLLEQADSANFER